jgi:uncharacterized protein (TIGR03067 family)
MNVRLPLTLLLALGLASLTFADSGNDTGSYSFTPMDSGGQDLQGGEWKLAGIKQGQQNIPEELLKQIDMRFTFRGGKMTLTMTMGGQKVETKEGTFKLNTSKRPREIDMTADNQTMLGIYEFEKDTLKIAMGPGKRPTSFDVKGGDEIVFILKRVAK